mgnify:FL=1|tara:strand:- start:52 stop:450 length:399 start_codon:yes stop_codon:yes gene_type:complete
MAIKITGGDKFQARLNDLVQKYPDVLDLALDDTADLISLVAQRIVPVDTGRLKSSINVKRKYLKKTIGTNVKYAAWIEYGKPIGGKTTMKWKKGKGLVPRDTSPLGPRPYFRPAFQNNKDKVSNFFIRNLPQ